MDLKALTTKVVNYGTTIVIAVSSILLIICSFIVQDTGYIRHDPKFFLSETLTMGVLSSLPVVLIAHLRGHELADTVPHAVIMFLHIAFLHVTFQLSGVYSALFPKSAF